MTPEEVKSLILESVSCNIYEEVEVSDWICEYFAGIIASQKIQIEDLKIKSSDIWEDRMGGQFTKEEIDRSRFY